MSITKKVEETNHRFKPMKFRAFNMVMALLVARCNICDRVDMVLQI